MHTKVQQAIGELLYQRDRLILPGIGIFESETTPAKADFIQGIIYPPIRTYSFKETEAADDRTLVDYVARQNNISVVQADEYVRNFVSSTQQSLNRRDVILLPEVGQIYRDVNQKIQFVSEKNRNYNTQVFGLPTLQFDRLSSTANAVPNPLISSTFPDSAAIPTPFAENATASDNASHSMWQNISSIQLLVLLATIFLLLATALTCARNNKSLSENQSTAYPRIIVNESPTSSKPLDLPEPEPEATYKEKLPETDIVAEEPPIFEEVEEKPKVKAAPKRSKPVEKQVKSSTSTRKSTEKASRTQASKSQINLSKSIAIIGCFNNAQTIKNKVALIKGAGFEPFVQKVKGHTRVGIRYYYDSEASKQKLIARFKRQFSIETWELRV